MYLLANRIFKPIQFRMNIRLLFVTFVFFGASVSRNNPFS